MNKVLSEMTTPVDCLIMNSTVETDADVPEPTLLERA